MSFQRAMEDFPFLLISPQFKHSLSYEPTDVYLKLLINVTAQHLTCESEGNDQFPLQILPHVSQWQGKRPQRYSPRRCPVQEPISNQQRSTVLMLCMCMRTCVMMGVGQRRPKSARCRRKTAQDSDLRCCRSKHKEKIQYIFPFSSMFMF